MNFLITGAAGFLGSSLANHLAREGHQVRGLDDLSTGNPQALAPDGGDRQLMDQRRGQVVQQGLDDLSTGDPQALGPDVHFTRGDVSDRPKLWTLLQEVDVVYHLAARVSVPESILYPRDYNNVNVGGTVALMEAMRDVGVRRVVLTSSGAVYGDLVEQPLRESVTPNPRSPYAVSKLAAEYYVRTIGGLWGIDTLSLRIFNAYGPGQHLPASHPPVVPHYLRQAQRSGTLVAHGDGSPTRDYVYVDDVISALVAAATAPNVNGLVINVGSGKETSIRDLIKAVQDADLRVVAQRVQPPRTGCVNHLLQVGPQFELGGRQ